MICNFSLGLILYTGKQNKIQYTYLYIRTPVT